MRDIADPNLLFERILANKNIQVVIEGKTYWVVEGDVMMDESRIRSYAIERTEEAQKRQEGEPVDERQGLLAIAGTDGRIVRWHKKKVLTYCMRYSSFNGNEIEYQHVVMAMNQAAKDWEAVCAVKFCHLVEFDQGDLAGEEPPLFDVRRVNQYPNLLALAFFPDSPKDERHVWISGAFFDSRRNPYGMEGVLRHELGHVLGFRHEHIRYGAPVSCEESYHSSQGGDTTINTVPLTPYDQTSVMHYMCPNMKLDNPTWIISEKDREGAQAVYGTPDGKLAPPDYKMDYKD